MKFVATAYLMLLAANAQSAETKKAYAKREPASAVQCQSAALEAAKFIDKQGWGEVASEPLKVVSGTRDQLRNEEFAIKSTVSGFTYKVEIVQDYRSEACIVTSITTR